MGPLAPLAFLLLLHGPAFWGLINPDWSLCSRGRRQSPVDLDPARILYDPNLRLIHIEKTRVSGVIRNTGHGVVFSLIDEIGPKMTGGPLSYTYSFHELILHFGLRDDGGSEHSVAGKAFPAELQMYGFNSELHGNWSEAAGAPGGLVAVSVLLQLGDLSNPELRLLTDQLGRIRYGGETSSVERISLAALLPNTDQFITYDGSSTSPDCAETVTWIVLNKPIYITKQQLVALRRLVQGDENFSRGPLGPNSRPPQQLHHRVLRTNIRHQQGGECGPPREVRYSGEAPKV